VHKEWHQKTSSSELQLQPGAEAVAQFIVDVLDDAVATATTASELHHVCRCSSAAAALFVDPQPADADIAPRRQLIYLFIWVIEKQGSWHIAPGICQRRTCQIRIRRICRCHVTSFQPISVESSWLLNYVIDKIKLDTFANQQSRLKTPVYNFQIVRPACGTVFLKFISINESSNEARTAGGLGGLAPPPNGGISPPKAGMP